MHDSANEGGDFTVISDPCGIEVLVAPIVIVPAATTSGAIAMDATSGGKSHISEPKFNEWRKIARPRP